MIQIKGGVIVNRQLPKTGYLTNGRAVSNYDCLPEEVLRKEGWVDEKEAIKKGLIVEVK